jgi:hypothetical protein
LFGRKKKNRLKELGCTLSHLIAIRRAVYSKTAVSRYAIIVEDVAYQKALIQQLSEYDLPVIPLKVAKHKWIRANYITPWLREGRIRINTEALKKQMLRFRGKTEKNDLVDALVNGITYIKDYESDGFEQNLDNMQGVSQLDRKLRRYVDKQRLQSLGVEQVFNDAPASYGDAEYF